MNDQQYAVIRIACQGELASLLTLDEFPSASVEFFNSSSFLTVVPFWAIDYQDLVMPTPAVCDRGHRNLWPKPFKLLRCMIFLHLYRLGKNGTRA
jgi:hypothetical protein